MTREEAVKVIENRDSIYCERAQLREALEMAIEALEQEPCEDAISRQAAIDYLFRPYSNEELYSNIDIAKLIKELPSVTPKQRIGHWVKISPAGVYECSECGQNVMTGDIDAYRHCHGCGAKMAESEE